MCLHKVLSMSDSDMVHVVESCQVQAALGFGADFQFGLSVCTCKIYACLDVLIFRNAACFQPVHILLYILLFPMEAGVHHTFDSLQSPYDPVARLTTAAGVGWIAWE
jgi:hypothetical protein